MMIKRALLVLVMCVYQVASIRILGGNRDSDGCLESAGYVWCDEIGECLHVTQNCIKYLNEM